MKDDKKIIVYGTTYCPYCVKAKAYLKSKGVDFIEKNIEEDENAYRELSEKLDGKFRTVPVIDFNGYIIMDSSETAIDEALSQANI
jgi:glutaredoxin